VIAIALDGEMPPALIAARSAAPRPPAIVAPGPRQISFGRVQGTVGPGVTRVLVTVNGVVRGSRVPNRGRYRFVLDLPPRDVRIRVIAENAAGQRSFRVVGPVYGLPRRGRPTPSRPSAEDASLARVVRRLTAGYGGIPAVYVQDLQTRRGAAWNARARFPAASTIKLAIAVEVLRTLRYRPAPGSYLYSRLRSMLVYSDNEAANSLLTWLGGSTSGGAAEVNSMLRSLGLRNTTMYGGYAVATATRPIPVRVEKQPAFGVGKYTTAYDLAALHRAVHLAAGGRGGLLRISGRFTRADARFLMWLLAHVVDHGKVDRFLAERIPVLHKAGWITTARHDAGIVYWRGGSYVVAVMAWNGSGVGTSADVLAGRVAAAGLTRFRELRRAASTTTPGGAGILT
jgi:Beta-lactamase enzyme family